jgi:hypothetical protein
MISHRSVATTDQAQLSDAARIELVLRFADRSELINTIKHDPIIAYQVYKDRTSKDLMIWPKRKLLLAFIFDRINHDQAR